MASGMVKIVALLGVGLVGLFIVLVLGLILIAGYFGFVPILSDMMGSNKPRDLGVSFTSADYASGIAKVPGAQVLNPEYLCLICEYESSGSIPTKTTFTSEEFSAMLNKRNSDTGFVDDIQVKFNPDGTVELSSLINTLGLEGIPEINGPIYAKGKIKDYSKRGLELDLETAEFGRMGVPEDQLPQVEDVVNALIEQTFVQNPGLSINTIAVTAGGIMFDGTLPESVEGDPNASILLGN